MGTICWSRRRTVRSRRRLQQIHRVRRRKGEDEAEQQRGRYERRLTFARRALRQAKRVRDALAAPRETDEAGPAGAPSALVCVWARAQRLRAPFGRFLPLVQRGIQQAQTRVLGGQQVASAENVLSLFEPHTRVVKRHKLGAAVEFGRQVIGRSSSTRSRVASSRAVRCSPTARASATRRCRRSRITAASSGIRPGW